MNAAGLLFRSPQDRVLLLKRSEEGDHGGEWCFPGGGVEDGESSLDAAIRECYEEIGGVPSDIQPVLFARRIAEGVDYTTFLANVAEEFSPRLNEEHTEFLWASPDDLPQGMHPGAELAVDKLSMNELDIARAIAAGQLTSPQRYENLWLFDLRITGLGASYRKKLKEYVWRDPGIYLNKDFLARCNGLPVVLEHPKKNVLDSKEFANRVIGTIFLPYIVDEEVWGIAKIYDDAAAEMMAKLPLSTSPAVSFSNTKTNIKRRFKDGTTLLVEGDPSLLDHLAICEQGVWDKDGGPTGVRSENRGDSNMPDVEMPAAAPEGGGGGDKLDLLLECFGSLLDVMEGYEKELASMKGGGDGEEVEAAEETEPSEETVPEPVMEDSASMMDSQEIKRRLDTIERGMTGPTDADRAAMADAQARCDRVAQVFGDAAPRPLSGETLVDYRRRLVSGYRKHSKTWATVDLSKVPVEVLDIAEPVIYADALQAGMHPTDAPADTLREVRTNDRAGRTISTFYGNPNAWMGQFRAPSRRVTRLGAENRSV